MSDSEEWEIYDRLIDEILDRLTEAVRLRDRLLAERASKKCNCGVSQIPQDESGIPYLHLKSCPARKK